jgi:hypothetical protein
LRSEVVVVVER